MIDKVHVAIIRWNLADDYNRHTAACMVSVMEHCSKPVVFHLLHEERVSFQNRTAADENILKYQEMVQHYKSEVEFHNVTLPEWINEENIPTLKFFGTPTGFYRLFLPDLLPELDWVISIGSDVIVKTDLVSLLLQVPESYSRAGCYSDEDMRKRPPEQLKYYQSLGIPLDKYVNVNADVLIFNLGKIRKEHTLPEKALHFLKQYPSVPLLDQDVCNYLFITDTYYLNPKYNLCVYFREDKVNEIISKENLEEGYIIHYAGSPKPWQDFRTNYDFDYWYYLSLTPWGSGQKVYKYMRGVFLPKDVIAKDVLENMDHYIRRYPPKKILHILWKFTIPLYIKIYKMYVNRGKNNEENMQRNEDAERKL